MKTHHGKYVEYKNTLQIKKFIGLNDYIKMFGDIL